MPAAGGSLTVVGTGIDVTTQLTPGARAAIESADVVFYLLTDAVGSLRIEQLNAHVRPLDPYYAAGKDRRLTYEEIVQAVVGEVLAGAGVCVALYGHPGFYAVVGHEAIRRVRDAGLPARMVPGVSALDCLFADLGIDPGLRGMQTYEATYFLRTGPPVDPRATLVLLQVGVLGESGGAPTAAVAERFSSLLELLRPHYRDDCLAVLYEAATYPGTRPAIVRFGLHDDDLPTPTLLSTLCVTP